MPFIILGMIVMTLGVFFYRFGIKSGSHEMRNGAIAWFLGGFFMTLWGLIIIFTGNLR